MSDNPQPITVRKHPTKVLVVDSPKAVADLAETVQEVSRFDTHPHEFLRFENFQKLQADVNKKLNKCQKCQSFALLRAQFRTGMAVEFRKKPSVVFIGCSKCQIRTKLSFDIAFPWVHAENLKNLINQWNTDWFAHLRPILDKAGAIEPGKKKSGRPRKVVK